MNTSNQRRNPVPEPRILIRKVISRKEIYPGSLFWFWFRNKFYDLNFSFHIRIRITYIMNLYLEQGLENLDILLFWSIFLLNFNSKLLIERNIETKSKKYFEASFDVIGSVFILSKLLVSMRNRRYNLFHFQSESFSFKMLRLRHDIQGIDTNNVQKCMKIDWMALKLQR